MSVFIKEMLELGSALTINENYFVLELVLWGVKADFKYLSRHI